jgi:ubiquinone biosynthesis protein
MSILVPKVATASLEDLDFGVTLTSVLKYATRRGVQTNPAVSLLGKSFSNIEGSVRCLAPELALTEVFEEELHGILIHLAGETVSQLQAARTAMDLMVGNTLVPEQLRTLARDLADRDFTVRVGRLRDGVPSGTGGGSVLPWAAAVGATAALAWHTGRRRGDGGPRRPAPRTR